MNFLSFIILTFNEEKNLTECCRPILDMKYPLFVVDSYSTDNTVQILKDYNIAYTQHPFENYAAQRNWSQINNPFNTEWVFHLDAGERLSYELISWLKKDFNPNDNSVDGYLFSRRTIIFNQEIKYGGHYPNYHLRLFRKNNGYCEEKLYDQHFIVNGKIEVIKNRCDIIDNVLDSWYNFIQAHNRWALFEAIEIVQKKHVEKNEVKPKLLGTPIERRRWLKNNIFQKAPLFSRSLLFFLYRYFIKMGFLDGKTGLAFHFLQGFWFRFLVDANVMEIRKKMINHSSLKDLVEKEYGGNFVKLVR